MDKPGSLRERKKAGVRNQLVKTASRLFAAKGFDNVTVDEIAAKSDVSRSTFFRYFPTKEALVFRNHARRLQAFRALLEAARAGLPPLEAVQEALSGLAKLYMDERDLLAAEYRIVMSSPYLIAKDIELDSRFQMAIVHALDDGGPRGRFGARMTGAAIFGMIRAGMEDWFARGCRDDLVNQSARVWEFLNGGFGARTETPQSRGR